MGYLMADAAVRVLEQMKAPTREAMVEAARNMNKVELGLLYPGITMTTKAGVDNFPIEAMQALPFRRGEAYEPIGKSNRLRGPHARLRAEFIGAYNVVAANQL